MNELMLSFFEPTPVELRRPLLAIVYALGAIGNVVEAIVKHDPVGVMGLVMIALTFLWAWKQDYDY